MSGSSLCGCSSELAALSAWAWVSSSSLGEFGCEREIEGSVAMFDIHQDYKLRLYTRDSSEGNRLFQSQVPLLMGGLKSLASWSAIFAQRKIRSAESSIRVRCVYPRKRQSRPGNEKRK